MVLGIEPESRRSDLEHYVISAIKNHCKYGADQSLKRVAREGNSEEEDVDGDRAGDEAAERKAEVLRQREALNKKKNRRQKRSNAVSFQFANTFPTRRFTHNHHCPVSNHRSPTAGRPLIRNRLISAACKSQSISGLHRRRLLPSCCRRTRVKPIRLSRSTRWNLRRSNTQVGTTISA